MLLYFFVFYFQEDETVLVDIMEVEDSTSFESVRVVYFVSSFPQGVFLTVNKCTVVVRFL